MGNVTMTALKGEVTNDYLGYYELIEELKYVVTKTKCNYRPSVKISLIKSGFDKLYIPGTNIADFKLGDKLINKNLKLVLDLFVVIRYCDQISISKEELFHIRSLSHEFKSEKIDMDYNGHKEVVMLNDEEVSRYKYLIENYDITNETLINNSGNLLATIGIEALAPYILSNLY